VSIQAEDGDLLVGAAMRGFRLPGIILDSMILSDPPTLRPHRLIINGHVGAAEGIGGFLFKSEFKEMKGGIRA